MSVTTMDTFAIARRVETTLVNRFMTKYGYRLMTRKLIASGEDVVFLNYGYQEDPPMKLPLSAEDEPYRPSIQLYERTLAGVEIRGKDVLEISCGHGGGASYIVRSFAPTSYTGLDANAEGIAFCRMRHRLPTLSFVHSNAAKLPFGANSFDVVVSAEGSHGHYPRFRAFLSEVARVLRPGGHFLYADLRHRNEVEAWEAALAEAPMRMTSNERINSEILRGMTLTSTRFVELAERHLHPLIQPMARILGAAPGTRYYREMERGDVTYRVCSFIRD